ncbi:MAG: ATP-dependent helicase [Candidatus Sericytochromatia bacterium]
MQLFLTDPLLEGLNHEQEKAVTTIKGTVQTVAGAGSGKTTVLTRRIAYMINQGIKPESILAVTFTKKAATEMVSRLKKLITNKKTVEALSIGTYHSLFLDLLSPYYGYLGYSSEKNPSICLDNRQKIILTNIINESGSSLNLDETTTFIGQIKNNGIYPEELERLYHDGTKVVKGLNHDEYVNLIQIYKKYQRYFLENNLIDFDDILMLTRKVLNENKEAREKIQAKYKYVLVDEFQDVNKVQYDITKMIAFPENNLFVVGDDYQSIYQFRGSDVDIILNFSKEYPNTQIIKMEENYRCTPDIIDYSNTLIKFNKSQIAKNVKAMNRNIKDSVVLAPFDDIQEESFNVAKKIRGFLFQGIKPDEIAILYRNHSQANYLEEDLIGFNIPYTIHKNGSFYDLPEVQDLFGFLKLADGSPELLDEGFERGFRAFGITVQNSDLIRSYARNNEISLINACISALSMNIHPGQRMILDRLINNVMHWQNVSKTMKFPDLINYVLESSGYLRKLEIKGTESALNAINNLEIIYEKAVKWNCESVNDFFKEIEKQEIKKKENKNKKQAVQLMTIHNSKGMEFDVVFIIGMEEEILPHKKSLEIGDDTEERRLCYVAMTRAKKHLLISRAIHRNRFGKRYKTVVSRFWQEIEGHKY